MTPESQPSETPATESKGSSGLLMIGAAILAGGHLLFQLILGEYNFGTTNVSVALVLLLGILGIGGLNIGAKTQKVLGFFLGMSGALSLLLDIRFGFPSGAVDNIANFVFYVGCLTAFLGARGMKDA